VLVVIEVALAMLIASGAALLVRSVANLYAIDPGLDTGGVAVVDVVMSGDLAQRDPAREIERIRAALAALPGAKSAAAAMRIPLRGNSNSFGIAIEGKPDLERSFTFFRVVSPEYFATMGIKLRDGRTFDVSDLAARWDTAATEMPVVINEALAKKYFPGEQPIGRLMRGGFGGAERVIGVVADVAEGDLTAGPSPARYYLAGSRTWWGSQASYVVRTTRPGDASTILEAARRAVQRESPAVAIQGTTTMSRVMDTAVGPARQVMSLLTLLSALALLLGAVGIYGVVSHFATRRKRDWAIRVALGLRSSRVVSHIVGQGAGLVLAGIAVGLVGTLALTRALSSFLYGVGTVDPIAFAGASAALLLVGVAAAFIPARRAGTVDPAVILREQ
jgi:predicted permease